MMIVDTSVWVPYFNGQISEKVNALDYLLGRELVIMGDLILTEVLQGFLHDDHFHAAKQLLGSLETRSLGGGEIAMAAANNARKIRKAGHPAPKTVDSIIGTYCLLHNIPLLHDDETFDIMEEVLELPCY